MPAVDVKGLQQTDPNNGHQWSAVN